MPSLPPNYREVLYWRITDKPRRLLIMNLLSLPLTLIAGLILTWFAVQVGRLLSLARLEAHLSDIFFLLIGVAITLILHELTHGLTMQIFGGHPQYGVLLKALAFYATAPGEVFTRNQYLIITLAPLVSLSLLAIFLMGVFSGLPIVVLFLICATLNASGASGDVWMTALVLRYPRTAYIMDERDGMRIFLPQ